VLSTSARCCGSRAERPFSFVSSKAISIMAGSSPFSFLRKGYGYIFIFMYVFAYPLVTLGRTEELSCNVYIHLAHTDYKTFIRHNSLQSVTSLLYLWELWGGSDT
jgi:hypothetical protein